MRSLLVVLFYAVYSAQAWVQDFSNLHVQTKTGFIPPAYYPLTADDKHATRKAQTFVNFIKIVPQLNPFKLPALGPYRIELPELNLRGDLQLDSITVNGIKTLILSALEVRMAPTRIDFNVSVPYADADVNFQLAATLGNQAINVKGHVNVLLANLAVGAAVAPQVELVEGYQVYQVNSALVDIDLKNLEVNMDMNQHSEEFRTILITFLQNPQAYSNIIDDLLRAVLKAVNQELTRISAKEILQYLLGTTRPGEAIAQLSG